MTARPLLGGLGGAALGLLGYATLIEPYRIEVVRLQISVPRLPRAFDGFSLLQVSDLHMRQLGRRERRLRDIIKTLPTPDVVAVTGDLIHTPQGIAPFLSLADCFTSRDGVYAVFGNSEHKNGVRPHQFAETLAANGIVPLLNRHALLHRDGQAIALAGVDDPVNDYDRLGDALDGVDPLTCVVALLHSPDHIAEAIFRGVDLVLSGHTHGGQVRVPGLGPVYTHSRLGRRMSDGYYHGKRLRRAVGIRPGRTQLYVTRGIGVSGLALRFLTRPELTWITLRPGSPACARV